MEKMWNVKNHGMLRSSRKREKKADNEEGLEYGHDWGFKS